MGSRISDVPRSVFWTFPRFYRGKNWKQCFSSFKNRVLLLKIVISTDFDTEFPRLGGNGKLGDKTQGTVGSTDKK